MTEHIELDLSGVTVVLIAADGSDAKGGLLEAEQKLVIATPHF